MLLQQGMQVGVLRWVGLVCLLRDEDGRFDEGGRRTMPESLMCGSLAVVPWTTLPDFSRS